MRRASKISALILQKSYKLNLKTPNITKFLHARSHFYKFSSQVRHTKLLMPALSPTMEKGNIVKWCFNEGDEISVGDILFEVETDKATVGYEVQDSGFLAKILVQEGTKDVSIGTQVAIIVDSKSELQATQNLSVSQQQEPKVTAPQEQKPMVAQKQYPRHQKLTMPSLSPTMTSGKVKEWLKSEGDALQVGDILCDIETDKASVGFELQDEGYLAKIINPETGIDLQVGEIIAIIVDSKDQVAAFKDYSPNVQSVPQQDLQQQEQVAQQKLTQTSQNQQNRVFISPFARKLASEKNIDFTQIQGSGPNNRIIASDVQNFKQPQQQAQQAQQAQQPVQQTKQSTPVQTQKSVESENPYTEIPLSNIRKTIAARLLESKTTIPHYYLTKTVTMDESLKLRQQLIADSGVKISVNDMIIKAASLACIKVPEVNSQWHGTHIKQFEHCDVSVAVSTETGLITPIVFNANQKGFGQISKDVKSLAEKARNNKLKPQEFIGGTFTISNLGMFGIDNFSAIINPPQSCILAVGKTEKKVIFDPSNSEMPYRVAQQMTVTMSCDHRVVDGAVGAQWLLAFAEYLEKPYTMLL